VTDTAKFNLNNIFVGVTETPGPNRLAVARLNQKNDKGEDLYQIINRSSDSETRSKPLNAEAVMVALLKVIDDNIFKRPNTLSLNRKPKPNDFQ
jgi:hypothetical protein